MESGCTLSSGIGFRFLSFAGLIEWRGLQGIDEALDEGKELTQVFKCHPFAALHMVNAPSPTPRPIQACLLPLPPETNDKCVLGGWWWMIRHLTSAQKNCSFKEQSSKEVSKKYQIGSCLSIKYCALQIPGNAAAVSD